MNEIIDSEHFGQRAETMHYVKTEDFFSDVCSIIDGANSFARATVNVGLVYRNWLLGKRICEEELVGSDRAIYGKEVIAKLSQRLTSTYGGGFTKRDLYWYAQFYREYPGIVYSLSTQSRLLSWTHYRMLLGVKKQRGAHMVRERERSAKLERANPKAQY